MYLTIIFAVSGVCLCILVGAKMWQVKHKKTFFLLNLISKSDHRIKEVTHRATYHYSEIKEKGGFMLKKQLPLHSKNIMNKTETLIREKSEKYFGNIRNTRLLKPKTGGISEFFRNMADIEKNGNVEESSESEE
jgi:hypothetical protein